MGYTHTHTHTLQEDLTLLNIHMYTYPKEGPIRHLKQLLIDLNHDLNTE